jgi:hypothetical protein
MNKKMWIAGAALAAVAGAGVVTAATISNINGQSCGDSVGLWHFVNNQKEGAARGTLTATWDSGDTCIVVAGKVNGGTQHFYCSASGALSSASTNLPGRLVLSDFSCDIKEPPKCDPKYQVCK